MAERRSLISGVEGVGVDPETARAFIVQERPKPEPPAKSSPVRVVPEPVPPPAAEPSAPVAPAAQAIVPAGEGTAPAVSPPPRPPAAKRPDPPRLLATFLVPVTVRLRPEVASALKRASLERQLNGVETYTQQDIVEEALLPWLRAEGLLE